MKKQAFAAILFFAAGFVFAQNGIDVCISYLGKAAPNSFRRLDRTTYTNDDNSVVLSVQNGIVYASSIAAAFAYSHEAHNWLADYYNYFETQNWEFSDGDSEVDVYVKNGILAFCIKPSKRDDGLIVAVVMFTKDEYQDMF